MEASKLRITPAFWEATHVGSGGAHDNPTDVYEVTNHYARICEYCTEVDAKLIVDAGNTYHETGKTPRQLAEENARLRAALEAAAYELITLHPRISGQYQSSVKAAYDQARAALKGN